MYRKHVSSGKSRSLFARTAVKGKKVNIRPTSMRGGFRF